MFGLIKWLIIFLILGAFIYVANFFMVMDQDSIHQVKKDAIIAIESGDAQALTGPLSDQMKQDLKIKQESFMGLFKKKIKETLHHLID